MVVLRSYQIILYILFSNLSINKNHSVYINSVIIVKMKKQCFCVFYSPNLSLPYCHIFVHDDHYKDCPHLFGWHKVFNAIILATSMHVCE